jgi:5-methylcytosine-specific restriction endonuclease McrA
VIHSPVLVLSQSYEPLNVCRAKRAIVLIARGKAEVIEYADGFIHTISEVLPLPSVIRLVYPVHRPRHPVRLSRHEVFIRDEYTCQYCGKRTRDLTIDHVIPRNRGGTSTWDNVVSACKSCNHRKAGRTPAEARMRLIRPPKPPQPSPFFLFYEYLQARPEWHIFLSQEDRAKLARAVPLGMDGHQRPAPFFGDGLAEDEGAS